MKKTIYILLIIIIFGFTTACSNKYALKFKNDYESLNGIVDKNGKENRTVTISKDNPYIEVKASDIVEKINNKETFYVYFGDKQCPWCRSVIEKSIEVSKTNKIDKIYYVAIWNDEKEEILRDKKELNDGKIIDTVKGDSNYYKLLEIFDDLLSDYTLTDHDGNKISTNEKRIYAPNFIYIEKGVPKKLITGISSLQKDAREELTKEILEEEEKQFKEFFNN